jgi:hypothetical protein
MGYVLHNDPENSKTAIDKSSTETWKPESKWEFVPFNHGPRICLGQKFAHVQMKYFLARLCQEYESISLLSVSQPQEGLMRLELNTKLAYPVYAECVRRSSEPTKN